jgi:hypothetical protein
MSDITPLHPSPVDSYSYPNLTTQELDRDLVNLFLPELDLLAQPRELERLYPAGFWDDLLPAEAELLRVA